MNLFETVKNNVSLREAAQAYGLEVNRHGKALCPFHNDRHPSLYVANDHYYCFTCGEHGDVIDFTARLFDLKPYDAAMKLVIDFHLDPDKPPSAAALNAKRIRTEAQKLKENERLCFSVLSDYYRCLEEWKAYAHILLTVRPLDESGKWQYKTEKEYLCSRDGEERGFTAAEFKAAQADGWEKQYQYKVGRKKVYMTPSAAEEHGYERASKYPKSTKYGRQNPISERWNSEEQLLIWRKAWADVTNKYLERYGHEERIDHRSFVERGIDEQPTIHEGVIARALEQKGIVSDRCELNRQIKADNRLLRELKAQFKKITEAVKNTLPAIAEALEKLRENMLIFCYQLGHIRSSKKQMTGALNILKPNLAQYRSLVQQIKETTKERKSLLAEKKSLPAIHFVRHRELASKIAELTEKLEELKSEKAMLLHSLEYPEDATSDIFQRQIDRYEDNLKRLEAQENKYAGELEAALSEYAELKEQASGFDSLQLYLERKALRPDREKAAAQRIEAAYGDKFSWWLMESGLRDVSGYLDEYAQEKTMDRELRQRRRSERLERKMKNRDMER